jgi:hypothetical protein
MPRNAEMLPRIGAQDKSGDTDSDGFDRTGVVDCVGGGGGGGEAAFIETDEEQTGSGETTEFKGVRKADSFDSTIVSMSVSKSHCDDSSDAVKMENTSKTLVTFDVG